MKFFSVIVLLAVAVYSNGEPQVSNKVTASRSALIDVVESLRETLRTGNEELGIPVCEPLEIEALDFTFEESFATLSGSISNLKVEGLTNFTIDTVTFSVIGIRFTYSFTWPVVTYKTGYKIDGTISNVMPIYGSGDISGSLTNLRVSGTVQLSVRDSFLFVRSMSTSIKLEALDLTITGLLNNDDMSALASAAISEMAPQLIEDYQTEITTFVNEALTTVADGFLGTMTLSELLDLIRG